LINVGFERANEDSVHMESKCTRPLTLARIPGEGIIWKRNCVGHGETWRIAVPGPIIKA
jgi:hypothetical protein